MSGRKPYVQAIDRFWWARRPYLAYTLREATGLAVAGYALVLLAGVICLGRGEAAYAVWLAFLESPWSVLLHLFFLLAMLLHVLTWFQIMPKTMPRLVIRGWVVPQSLITGAGFVVAIATFLTTLGAAKWVSS
jgi:fumarate reductase subunit C